jgi:signal transduction histidine kinase/CheY-like chemotaxis protein
VDPIAQDYRRQTLRGFSGAAALTLLLLVGINLLSGTANVVPATLSVATLFGLFSWVSRTTKYLTRWAHLALICSAALLILSSTNKGGLPSVTLGWAPLFVVLASLVLGRRGALIWTVLLSGAVGLVGVLALGGEWDPGLGTPASYAMIRIVALWVTLTLTLIYDSTTARAINAALKSAREAEAGRREVEKVRDELASQNQLLAEARALADAARGEAEQAIAVRGVFIANISHEIRTPINAVLGVTQMLDATSLSAEQRGLSRIILDSGQHLLHLINQTLDMSKMQAGRLELESSTFSPAEIAAAVRSMFAVEAKKRGVELVCDVASGTPEWVTGDPVRLQQVLINLMGNGIKFTLKGEVALRVRPAGDGRVLFGVSDTGIGIAQDVLPQLFDPFRQADSSTTRKFGGTGLGLSISRELVELMGGEINVYSKVGKGTTFMFILPLPLPLPFSEAPAQAEVAGPFELAGRVLVVEDNVINQKVARYLLEEMGLEVVVAENGRVAVELTSKNTFDLILMDCHMPVMDGFEATESIKALNPEAPPILALSASALEDERRRCFESGMSGFISKPVDQAQLYRALAAYLLIP